LYRQLARKVVTENHRRGRGNMACSGAIGMVKKEML
jgi:hypothetical protein